jgi:hypothetical protein
MIIDGGVQVVSSAGTDAGALERERGGRCSHEYPLGLAGYMKQISSNQEDFVNHPLDPEAVHKLRVSIRKLKSLLSFIAPYQNKGQNKEEQAFSEISAGTVVRKRA